MKKRTKISLTIVGLLATAGIIYAVSPAVTFSTFQGLTGVAVSKTEMFATGYVGSNSGVYTLNCADPPTLYQAAPDAEKYIAIAPAQSALAAVPFTPRDVFITYGSLI